MKNELNALLSDKDLSKVVGGVEQNDVLTNDEADAFFIVSAITDAYNAHDQAKVNKLFAEFH